MSSRELQRITPTQVDVFLSQYRKHGLMHRAAQAAGLTKHQISTYAKGKTPEAEQFALNLEAAAEEWGDTIRSEITRRAIDGVERDIYYKGMYVASEMVYSDTLLVKMAESTLPEYKKAVEKETGGIKIGRAHV